MSNSEHDPDRDRDRDDPRNRTVEEDEEDRQQPLDESDVSWEVRFARTRAAGILQLARPGITIWLTLAAGLMALTASHGDLNWELPIIYGALCNMYCLAAAIITNALDAEVDRNTRLWRPISAGLITARSGYVFAAIPFAIGTFFAFWFDWQVAIIYLTMVATVMLYNAAWRGSLLGVASFALLGVLMPVGAIQIIETSYPSAHLIWIIPIGALTGAAAFMIYKLPDYELDDVDGARSILHWLGIDTAIAMSWAVLTAALALAAASINLSGGNLLWLLGPLLYLLVVGLFCIWMLMRRISWARLVLQRWFILPGLSLFLICWLGAAASA